MHWKSRKCWKIKPQNSTDGVKLQGHSEQLMETGQKQNIIQAASNTPESMPIWRNDCTCNVCVWGGGGVDIWSNQSLEFQEQKMRYSSLIAQVLLIQTLHRNLSYCVRW